MKVVNMILVIVLVTIQSVNTDLIRDYENIKSNENKVFRQDRFKDLIDESYQLVSEQFLEEMVNQISNNIVLFTESHESEKLKIFKKVAEHFKVTLKIKHLIFSYIIDKPKKQPDRLIFFYKSRKTYLDGQIEEQKLIQFIDQIIDRTFYQLHTYEDFRLFESTFEEKQRVIAVYDTTMQRELKLLKNMLKNDIFEDIGNFKLAFTMDQSIIPYPQETETPSLILYKPKSSNDHQQQYLFKQNFTDAEDVLEFLQLNSLDSVSIYSEELAFRLFAASVNQQVLLFLDRNDTNNEQYLKEFQQAAEYNKNEQLHYERFLYIVVYYNIRDSEFQDSFGVYDDSTLPQLFVSKIDARVGQLIKYKYKKDSIETLFIQDFIEEINQKRIEIYYRSEDIPDYNQIYDDGLHPIQRIVGLNHDQKARRNRENVIVLYCASDIQFQYLCRSSILAYRYLVTKVLQNQPHIGIKFYYFDITKNEVDRLMVEQIPTLKIFKRGEKQNPDMKEGPFTLLDLDRFIKKNMHQFSTKFTKKENEKVIYQGVDQEDQIYFRNTDDQREQVQQKREEQEEEVQQQVQVNQKAKGIQELEQDYERVDMKSDL